MAGHFGLDALGLELAGKAIHAGREHAEPPSQQQHARFSGERAVAPQQGDGDREATGAEAQTRCVAILVCAHRREWAAVSASDPCNHVSQCPLFQPERPFVTSVTCVPLVPDLFVPGLSWVEPRSVAPGRFFPHYRAVAIGHANAANPYAACVISPPRFARNLPDTDLPAAA